ncbi:MAG: aminotransferase class I/II-fold pyridoxal phosphate-dependent enzyme [Elusimicrobia bacterium]|nr:aminotransferase class I/II-fold pyridoxal phosphate-dependent enzyme [Elusimicrobiota bacterium]
MKKFSERLNNFDEYVFAKLNREAKKIEQHTGRKVLNLAVGSPDVPPSEKLLAALCGAIKQKGMHLYPGYGMTPGFAEAVQNFYKTSYDVKIDTENLVPLLGAKDGITHLILALLDEGDEFLTPNPGYPGFTGPALMIGAKPVYYTLKEENGFKPDIKELEKLVTKKTKFIWLNFPSNPTGAILNLKELAVCAAFAKKHGIALIYDNAYAQMYYGGARPPSILQIKGARDFAVELHSLSKTFSLAGYRIGFAAGNKKILDTLAKIKSQTDSGLSLPLQKIAEYALSKPDVKWRNKMLASYTRRRDILARVFIKLGCKLQTPSAALYLWAHVPDKFKNGAEYAEFLLKEKQVLVTPGAAFGPAGEKYIRISFCSDISKIKEYL